MKVLVTSSDSYWLVDMFDYFRINKQWNIMYWCCSDKMTMQLVESRFPSAIIHNMFDAMRGIPPKNSFQDKEIPLDEEILIKYARCESISLKMMDRMAALSDFSYNERVRLYHRLLGYNLKLIRTFSPDLVFFGLSIPHMVYDYILYCICDILGIKTILFEKTNIPGLVYPISDICQPEKRIVDAYEAALEVELLENNNKIVSEYVSTYLTSVRGDYINGMPVHMKASNKKNTAQSQKSKIKSLLYDISFIYRNAISGTSMNYLKVKNKSVENYPNVIEYYVSKIDRENKLQKLKKYYEQISTGVSFDEPYIFVALQCQPEKSTSPMGGLFVHQLLMIKILRDVIPSSWRIYVKEHIAQFTSKEPARSKDIVLYDDIRSVPNTVLVSLNIEPFKLIDNSKFVACVTGSVGFEAIVRGKPILVFGNPWYSGCEGVFAVKTYDGCFSAVKRIVEGYKVNTRNVDLFCQVFYENGVHGYTTSDYQQCSEISEEDNLRAYITALDKISARKPQ